jgi:phytanoyl-CoA hydroxylase
MDQFVNPEEREKFDGVGYLQLYPDIAQAVGDGRTASAWDHYDRFGRYEGRIPTGFDPGFYGRSYQLAVEEIAAGHAATPLEHYRLFGRARGYLPYAKAPRPPNAAALASPFGGLWPDQADAADIIRGRWEIGQLTERQASLLQSWVRNGYVILRHSISPELIDRAAADLDRAYSGGFPDLRFECLDVDRGHIPWRAEINPHPAKALDIHHFSQAIRELMFAPPIAEFLGLIFQAKAFASQTLGFLRGCAQSGHQDSAYVPYTIARQFAATWIALEDVTIGAGELFYYEGSHRLEDFLYAGQFKSVSESQRMGDRANPQPEIEAHVASLEQRAQARGLKKLQFAAKRGDVLVWHADLVHGGNPVSREVTRKSIVTHYCPKHLAPLFVEHLPTRLYHHQGHVFTSSCYVNSDPA